MFIWKSNQKRCNPYRSYTDEQGTQHTRVPPELYEEIPDPARGNDEIEYTQELDEPPYIIITPKSPEQLARQQADKDKRNAEQHLSATDYLFNIDRHAVLLKDEPEREAELRQSREAARAVIRQYKLDYPRES
jgi:hypothetical protein